MTIARTLLPAAALVLAFGLTAASRRVAAQAPSQPSIEGAWTLNKDLSDQPQDQQTQRGRDDQGDRRRSGRGGYGGGRRGGGMGGGGGRAAMNPDDAERMREAMHDVMTPPDHLTIVQTGSMIVLTTQDGRTTRLSPDGKKVKDDNTKIERKTKWDAGKLVSEINGLGPSKITETYTVDPDKHQLRVTVQTDAARNRPARTQNRVYDLDKS